MIGLDTNVVIRYLTQDDKRQAALANALFEQQLSEISPGYINLVTLVEICWVLESCYEQDKPALIDVLNTLLGIKQIIVERTDLVFHAVQQFRQGAADFSDALITAINIDAGCRQTVTFDKKAKSVGMVLLSMPTT